MDDEAEQLFKLTKGQIKLFPGKKAPPEASFHICGRQPIQNETNHEGVCSVCGSKVYFSDDHPQLKKLCIPCAGKINAQYAASEHSYLHWSKN